MSCYIDPASGLPVCPPGSGGNSSGGGSQDSGGSTGGGDSGGSGGGGSPAPAPPPDYQAGGSSSSGGDQSQQAGGTGGPPPAKPPDYTAYTVEPAPPPRPRRRLHLLIDHWLRPDYPLPLTKSNPYESSILMWGGVPDYPDNGSLLDKAKWTAKELAGVAAAGASVPYEIASGLDQFVVEETGKAMESGNPVEEYAAAAAGGAAGFFLGAAMAYTGLFSPKAWREFAHALANPLETGESILATLETGNPAAVTTLAGTLAAPFLGKGPKVAKTLEVEPSKISVEQFQYFGKDSMVFWFREKGVGDVMGSLGDPLASDDYAAVVKGKAAYKVKPKAGGLLEPGSYEWLEAYDDILVRNILDADVEVKGRLFKKASKKVSYSSEVYKLPGRIQDLYMIDGRMRPEFRARPPLYDTLPRKVKTYGYESTQEFTIGPWKQAKILLDREVEVRGKLVEGSYDPVQELEKAWAETRTLGRAEPSLDLDIGVPLEEVLPKPALPIIAPQAAGKAGSRGTLIPGPRDWLRPPAAQKPAPPKPPTLETPIQATLPKPKLAPLQLPVPAQTPGQAQDIYTPPKPEPLTIQVLPRPEPAAEPAPAPETGVGVGVPIPWGPPWGRRGAPPAKAGAEWRYWELDYGPVNPLWVLGAGRRAAGRVKKRKRRRRRRGRRK